MTRLTIQGRLTAAQDRTLRGMLLPFHKPGRTNLGRVVVHPGGIEVPEDLGTLFAHLDHNDGRDDVATFREVTETPNGLEAIWDVAATHGGDKLLAEHADGTRTGISVELEPVRIRDGVASGRLIGCAFPETPAFDDARLVAELAPDTPAADLEDAEDVLQLARELYWRSTPDTLYPAGGWDTLTDEAKNTYTEAARTALAAINPSPPMLAEATPPEATPAAPTTGDTMSTTAMAPAALLAGAASQTPTPAPETGQRLTAAASFPTIMRLLAEAHGASGSEKRRLLAALTDIVPADIIDRDQPAWIGEMWSGKAYTRRIVPLLTQAALTGMKVKGWRWVTKPEMAKYAGNKEAVPSNAVGTEPYEEDAQRFAGAHDIDRKYKDFGDTEFFTAYFKAMTESYARLTDAYALEKMKANALATVPGSVPSGVSAGWGAVIDAALDVIDVGAPSFALVEKSVYRDMLFTKPDDVLAFLNASLGLEDGSLESFKIIPVASSAVGTASSPTGMDRGEVIVGTKAAITFRELGGGTPIRVDALDIANGGVDQGCFGYAHIDISDARGLRRVDLTPDV